MKAKLGLFLALALATASVHADDLAAQFLKPPSSSRPWVYWFWNNGNVTKAGITADLEAMKAAGIGGVIIMDVVERFAPPPGSADFMNAEWQELFLFAVSEAHRLGLEINMTNGPGWCGSSGPWITPELSMLRLVSAATTVEGPSHYARLLPRKEFKNGRSKDGFDSSVPFEDFYRDVAVLAYPENGGGFVPASAAQDLTARLAADGKLDWEAPPGKWTLLRIGCVSTGSSTRPPVKGGNGLECDKLNPEAMRVHFSHLMGKLIAQAGRSAENTLTATHIDSWEVGSQDWTPALRQEFQKRRGYDPLPFLPNILTDPSSKDGAFSPVSEVSIARRFRWDYEQTLSELLAENYVGCLAKLAHQHRMRLTIEGYNLPFGDEATYTEQADEPMSEFWATGGNENEAKGRQMASVAHVMGQKVIGAEAFTSGDNEQWRYHPATVKALGDYQFSQGINRFVIHRYAHQPYLDRFPGATMGPWGLHYERTQTWWAMSGAWHEYLSRCQFLLRQGLFVADLLYLRPEQPNQTYFKPEPRAPAGYRYDECSAKVLIERANVKDGRLVLPDGMSYRLLILPAQETLMTPALTKKIAQLVKAGATVLGPRPTASPSLADYPASDAEVARIAAKAWGDCDGLNTTKHKWGKGQILWGLPLTTVLKQLNTPADFSADQNLNWIHRQLGTTNLYFVANPQSFALGAQCTFRVQGLRPELWNPETGEMEPVAMYRKTNGATSLALQLEPCGSRFVVFRPQKQPYDAIVSFTRNGQPVASLPPAPAIRILKATYGVPGDAPRTRQVGDKLQALVQNTGGRFLVRDLANGDDPAYGVVKTLTVAYEIDGIAREAKGQDPEELNLAEGRELPQPAAKIHISGDGGLRLEAHEPGDYRIATRSGKAIQRTIAEVPAAREITGSWLVEFPPKWGAPESITLESLGSLSLSPIEGVKYFSGTATYTKTFDWTPAAPGAAARRSQLDLGNVAVMAQVTLNGQDLGTLWKPPFTITVTRALQPGANKLTIRVANLWPNRMIGDAALPSEKRYTWSSYEPFTKDSPLPASGLLGPVRLRTSIIK
jgi:hypothetical protein